MMLLGTQRINEAGHLEIGGCDTVELAERFGTPLYVMDEDHIRENCRRYVTAFRTSYGGDIAVAFAGKSFMTMAMCRIADQEGLHLDVASGGELYTAHAANFPMERILFHGSNKSVEELQMAIDLGVGRVVVDNFLEFKRLDEMARASGRTAGILLRLTPGIDPHTHRLIRTGQEDTKFGFNVKDGSAFRAVEESIKCPNIELWGLHCHVGSQLLDTVALEQAIRVMVKLIAQVAEIGYSPKELNLGGGLGIRYQSTQQPPSIEEFAERLSSTTKKELAKYKLDMPKLMVEPGRSIVGEAGTTLYRVGAIKTVHIKNAPGQRTYVSVDGGMSDNPRPALYGAKYEAVVANRAGAKEDAVITVAGKLCETDNLIVDAVVANPVAADILAVYSTGAYNYTMSSNYNRLPRPAAVLVSKGEARVIIRRETNDDLVSHDEIPEHLAPGSEA